MSRAAIFLLPLELRVALATRFPRSLAQDFSIPGRSSNIRISTHTSTTLNDSLAQRRYYATVNVDDTSKLWSQHGKPLPIKSSDDSSISEESSEQEHHALSAAIEGAHVLPEKEQLLSLVEGMIGERSRRKRPRLRRFVKSAAESEQPVIALRQLAHTHPSAWDYAEAKGMKSANVDDGTSDLIESQTIELLDFEYGKRNYPLPAREEYPEALPELFEPASASLAVHNACQKLKLSMQTEVDFTIKQEVTKAMLRSFKFGLQQIQVCSLKLDIADICHETAIGEGRSKLVAKQAAWLRLVSKMHVAGSLKELFPSDSTVQTTDEPSADETLEPLVSPVEVDKQKMKEEKDAIADIYNYAATHGLIPCVARKLVQPRTPRTRRAAMPKRPAPLHQVNIQLEEQGIDVTASGKDLTTAEVAAAIAFKEQAEQRYKSPEGNTLSPPPTAFIVLNVETAGKFFEFYRNREQGVNLEVEHEAVGGSQTRNSVKLTMNGKNIGHTVIMRSKKQAESIAYLTAAVEIASAEPQLLQEFTQVLHKGKGKVLRPLRTIDMEVGFEALQSMRNALVEARGAGLPDSRQALEAEIQATAEERVRLSWRLSPGAHQVGSKRLISQQKSFDNNPKLGELRSKKASLPMNHYREDVLRMIDQNQYSIVVGATGSGKTTQVPQILFEHAIRSGHGSSCNIICTQPRRIAATSIAQRVAVERNVSLRDTVGYHVRFDAKLPHDPYGIAYCTTGILLEKLKHAPDNVLDSTSHIIIDEVHERDLNIDFLMIVLKRAVRIRQAEGRSVPKVVLMSATLDAELFAEYFHGVDSSGRKLPCPTLTVPGRTYPVKEKYLGNIMDELLENHGSQIKAMLAEDTKNGDYLQAETSFSAGYEKNVSRSATEAVIDWKRERQQASVSQEDLTLRAEKEEALVPVTLMVATIAHICSTSADGAILAFLPGLEEILQAQISLLERQPLGLDFSDQSRFQICLLHSTIPKEQQAEIFRPSAPGCRKIILSTNIAETSVTVPDVKYVVDSGKLREKRYDQSRRITKLQCVWESKSNSKQRAGRAGRVQDGSYYALFSKERSLALRAVGLPELLRSDLQETCLSVKAQNFGEPIKSFLAQAIEPPSVHAIDAAIGNLISIEAFTPDEELTALGRVLSQLPVHPTLAKMIILGIVFRCLDPMIVLGAGAEERNLFVTPVGQRREADRTHRAYGSDSKSDHVAFLRAFDELRTIRNESGTAAANQRAQEAFLHMGAFRSIDQTGKQIEEILQQSGLISGDIASSPEYGPMDLNRNAKNHELVKGLLVAGFNPNIASKTQGMLYRTMAEHSVLMHPSSTNVEERKSESRHPYGTLFAYSNLSKGTTSDSLFMRDSTQVTPLMATLFGGQLRMTGSGRLEIDEWLPFFVKASDREFSTRLILEFRKALDRVLNGAFNSLSNFKDQRAAELASDPMRERFAQRVVEVLHYASGRHLQQAWPHHRFP